MCTVCGCTGKGAVITTGGKPDHDHHHHDHGHDHGHDHHHGHGHDHRHHHDHDHHHHHHDHGHVHQSPGGDLDYGAGPARSHVPGLSQSKMIEIETGILSKNDEYALENRQRLAKLETLALNLVSSPGSGKTTLLCKTIDMLKARAPVAVIEGDQQTTNDADRIRATGAPAVQINTGKGCHLDAHMVGHAIDHLDLPTGGVLFIENVGNLVCPAAFDLGEKAKVAILSVTEGEDKPLKYPDMFTAASIVLLNKVDLAPHCDIDISLYETNAKRINPNAQVLPVSAKTGEGMDAWLDWIDQHRQKAAVPAMDAAE